METLKKLKMPGSVAIVVMFIAGLHACGDRMARNNQDQSQNEEFIIEAASSNSLEIAAGSMAVSNGQHEAVRSFGQRMVDEHTAVRNEMTNIAESKGWSIPTELLNKHERELQRIGDLTGEDFDREFAELMVRSHEDAIDLFTDFAEEGDDDPNRRIDTELRDFASGKIADLRRHLDEANRLKDSVERPRDSTLMMRDSVPRQDPMN